MSSRHQRNLSASLYVRGLAEKVRYVKKKLKKNLSFKIKKKQH
jgi:hypothetical protein